MSLSNQVDVIEAFNSTSRYLCDLHQSVVDLKPPFWNWACP